jgi:hypothetical protein
VWKDSRLIALQIYDRDRKCILEAGESANLQWKYPEKKFPVYRCKVDEDERVVGVRSGQRGQQAYHFDLQFVIAKI